MGDKRKNRTALEKVAVTGMWQKRDFWGAGNNSFPDTSGNNMRTLTLKIHYSTYTCNLCFSLCTLQKKTIKII